MARDQELVSLASFGNDLLASGHFSSFDSVDLFAKTAINPRKTVTAVPEDEPSKPGLSKFGRGWAAISCATTAEATGDPGTLVVGGAPVKNVSLVIGDHDEHYRDLKIFPVPVAGAVSGGGSLLVAPVEEPGTQPMLFLAAKNNSDISFSKDASPVPLPKLKKELKESKGKVGAAAVDKYVLSGDIENFFGVPGLVAKLYSFQSEDDKKKEDDKAKDEKDGDGSNETTTEEKPADAASQGKEQKPAEEKEKPEESKEKKEKDGGKDKKDKKDDKDTPIDEKVKLQDMESPLKVLFPQIEEKTIQKLPIKNLEFMYSNKEKDNLFPTGLRLEGDIELKDGLQFVSDGFRNVFGSGKSTTLPTKLRISAHLGKDRDWSKKPKIEGMVLQAYFSDMTLPAWDFLEFKTVGMELSVRKETKKKDDKGKDEKDKGSGDGKEKKDDENDKEQKIEAKDESKSAPSSNAAQENAPEDPKAEAKESSTEVKDVVAKKDKGDKSSEPSKPEKKEEKEWKVGFGLFGKLKITKVPKSKESLEAKYWIRMGDWKEEKKKKDNEDKENKDGKGEDKDKKEKDGKVEGKGEEKEKPVVKTGEWETHKYDEKTTDKTDKEKTDKKDEEGPKGDKKDEDKGKGGKKYELVIKTGKWKDFCGVSNLSMKSAELRTFFKPGEFKDSCTLAVSGSLEFAQGSLDKKSDKKDEKKKIENTKSKELEKTDKKDDKEGTKKDDNKDEKEDKPKNATLTVKGQLSRSEYCPEYYDKTLFANLPLEDYQFDAKVGDLKLDSILKIYAQISGAQPSKEEVKGHDFTFEELHLNIGRS